MNICSVSMLVLCSLFKTRTPTWVGMTLLQQLVAMAVERPVLRGMAMLFIAAYAFLLRVPSEGIPMAAHSARRGCQAPVLTVSDSCIT